MAKEQWARFSVGDVFPATSVIGHWVAGLALISNDLITSNIPLVEQFERGDDRLSEIALFNFWLACAQYREAARYLGSARRSAEIERFNSGLPHEAQLQLRELRASFEPWEGSFVASVMKPLRDRLFHYPAPGKPEWHLVLHRLSSLESGVRFLDPGRIRDVRPIFADDVRASLLSTYLGADKDEIRVAMKRISDLIGTLVAFAHEALSAYLSDQPVGKIRIIAEPG